MLAFWKLVFAFIWTFILGGLCDKGYKSISWFLVLLPYILMFLASLNIYHVTEDQRQFMRSIQLQGAFGQEAYTSLSQEEYAMSQLLAEETPIMDKADKAKNVKLPDNATQSDKDQLAALKSKLSNARKEYDDLTLAGKSALIRLPRLLEIKRITTNIRVMLKNKYKINL
jgi:hypothetical protein